MSSMIGHRRRFAKQLQEGRHEIARVVTDRFLSAHPDWVDRYGAQARIRGEEDAVFHIDFLAGAVVADDVAAFENYTRWTAKVLSARGISPEFLAENLEQVREEAGAYVDAKGHGALDRMVRAGVAAVHGASEPAESAIPVDGPFQVEFAVYLQAVRSGDRRAALNVALEALRSGISVSDVYADILQPVQYEIGRLWEENEITVAEEHMATAITQYVVGHLYSLLDIPERSRGNALVTGVRGELHQLGANMVADVLEADGWNVRFLGTQLPHSGILEAIEEHQPRLVGISATLLFNLPAVADLVADVRRVSGPDTFVMVGGAGFRTSPELWREMGADGSARDLRGAVALASALGRVTED